MVIQMEKFVDYYEIVKKGFPGQYSDRHALGAFLCLLENHFREKELTQKDIDNSWSIIKKKVRVTSAFRDYLKLPLILKMAMSDDPEQYLNGIIKTYELIKATFFTGSGQRLLTAMAIYENTQNDQINEICSAMYDLYYRMKKEHPILTGQEDMIFAALLAMDREKHNDLIREIEECYDLLRKKFRHSMSPIQNVSHILALTDQLPEEKTEKFIALYETLKEEKEKTEIGPHLIVLAVLSILDITVDLAAEEVSKMDAFLKEQKGFHRLGVSSHDRRLIATAITAADHLPKENRMINGVNVALLKTILSTSMMSAIITTQSSFAMSGHK